MVGDSPPTPMTVRGVGESHEAVKQTDSGLGVDAQADPGRGGLKPWLAFAYQGSPHDLCHGWEIPCWLLALHYLFNIHIICSEVPSFTSDICNLYPLLLFLINLAKIYLLNDLFKLPAFGFIDFLYWIPIFNFIDGDCNSVFFTWLLWISVQFSR